MNSSLIKTFVLFIAMNLLAITPEIVADVRLSSDREVLSRFRLTNVKVAERAMAQGWDVSGNLLDGTFEVLVPLKHVDKFRSKYPTAILEAKDDLLENIQDKSLAGGFLTGYRSIEEVYSYINNLEVQFPQLASVSIFGKTSENREQIVLHLTDSKVPNKDKTPLLFTAATHGDELITVEVLLRLIGEIVEGFETNARIKLMLQNHELYFIPIVSPDSFARQSRHVDGLDPNRNFPWPQGPNVNSVLPIKNLIQFVDQHAIAGSIDFHAFGELVMYPWAYTKEPLVASDLAKFEFIGKNIATLNKYKVGQISKIIYVAKGSSADYWYWKNGTLAFGIEMAKGKVPSAQNISTIVSDNRELLFKFIESF